MLRVPVCQISGCCSSTTTLWTSLWLIYISSTVPWTLTAPKSLCPLTPWKKLSSQTCARCITSRRRTGFHVHTPEHAAYDKRTPGLFEEEYSGDGIIALCSKTYYCFGKEDKFSCKGINKRTNQIIKDKYMDVLLSKKSGSSTNRGFRSMDNQVFTYFQERTGFSYFYPKRKVLADGVSERITNKRKILSRSGEGEKGRCLP